MMSGLDTHDGVPPTGLAFLPCLDGLCTFDEICLDYQEALASLGYTYDCPGVLGGPQPE